MLRPQNADDRNQGWKDKLFTDWKSILSVPSSPPTIYVVNEILVKSEFYTYKLILKFTWKGKSNMSQNKFRKGNTKLEELRHWIKTSYKFWSSWSRSSLHMGPCQCASPTEMQRKLSGKWVSSMNGTTIRHPSACSQIQTKGRQPIV